MPRPRKDENTESLSIILSTDAVRTLEELAQEDRRTRNQMAAKIIEDQLRDRKKKVDE